MMPASTMETVMEREQKIIARRDGPVGAIVINNPDRHNALCRSNSNRVHH